MTDSPNRVGLPTRSTETLDPVARTDGRTDRTNEETNYDELSFSPNASPAGGLDDFDPHATQHNNAPHVYVVYWPDLGIIKVGFTTTQERWEWWTRRGGVLIATGHTCCESHARRIERDLLDIVKRFGAKAFASEQDARFVLGRNRGGYTECFRLIQSPRFREAPDHAYDYERAYGLILPPEFEETLKAYDIGAYPIHTWKSA